MCKTFRERRRTMAELNSNGGPSSDGMDSKRRKRPSVKKRSREEDGIILLEKLRASCQLLKDQADASK